jgi:hypothetical protein
MQLEANLQKTMQLEAYQVEARPGKRKRSVEGTNPALMLLSFDTYRALKKIVNLT